MTQAPPAVELRGLAKAFGACRANAGVSLRVEKGSIHGVIGENGAGKSTAMKMLYGMYRPDSGEIRVHGHPREWRSPSDAIAAGIGMVHQHFMLAGPHSALDNILLGRDARAFARVDRAGARKKLDELARRYGLPVDWDKPVEELPVGIQQRIEILKLLYCSADILILDEPTAVLTPQETEELFANLRKLKAEGKTILIITHKLKEVMSFTDRVTVFRAGRVTGERETGATSPQELADLMVGRKVLLNVEAPPEARTGKPVLELSRLSLVRPGEARPRLRELSLEVRSGEVVGIAGVEGNGQSELLQAILHPADRECLSSGAVRVLGQDVTRWSTDRIKALGMGVIPEDRHHQGLLLERPVAENFALGLHRRPPFASHGLLQMQVVRERGARALEAYDVRPRDLDLESGRLSGGNQQKLIIAREFEAQPRLLIAAQPTRGVDVGAIEFIHQRILRARNEGAGVLLVSSELDEVLSLSDRILVMYEGRIAGEFKRGQATERELGMRMAGHAG